jgi:uncharacterized repeat protein (TIGR03803 family)
MPKTVKLIALFLFATLISAPNLSASTEQILYSFTGGDSQPGGVIFDQQGNLYGVTSNGGQFGFGSVFELSSSANGWTETVLYSFTGGKDGRTPSQSQSLVFDKAGNLYGTTIRGGKTNSGTVFRLSPSGGGQWTEIVVHSFQVSPGSTPEAGVVFDAAGNLFGTTYEAGAGTVFEISPAGNGANFQVLHRFQSLSKQDGSGPEAALTVDADGNVYGTTYVGGTLGCGLAANGCGTVFKLSPKTGGGWSYRPIYRFLGGSDGERPLSSVVVSPAGDIYGTTFLGGISESNVCVANYPGCGTVYKLSPNSDGTYTHSVIYMFNGPPTDGADPTTGGLVLDASGNLFGTTWTGGPFFSSGTLFELTQTSGGWQETVLHSFGQGADGENPDTQLIMDTSGNIVGTTTGGGVNFEGTLYTVTP